MSRSRESLCCLSPVAAAVALALLSPSSFSQSAPAAKPEAMVQVTVWPAAVQPAGSVPIVRPVGIVSVIVETAFVAAVPVFDTCSV